MRIIREIEITEEDQARRGQGTGRREMRLMIRWQTPAEGRSALSWDSFESSFVSFTSKVGHRVFCSDPDNDVVNPCDDDRQRASDVRRVVHVADAEISAEVGDIWRDEPALVIGEVNG